MCAWARTSSVLGDEADAIDASDGGSSMHGTALAVGEVSRYRDDAVAALELGLLLDRALQLAEQHADHLLGREDHGRVVVRDLEADAAVFGLHDLVGRVLDLALHVLLGELASDETLDVDDRVGEVAQLADGGAFADVARFAVEASHGAERA